MHISFKVSEKLQIFRKILLRKFHKSSFFNLSFDFSRVIKKTIVMNTKTTARTVRVDIFFASREMRFYR